MPEQRKKTISNLGGILEVLLISVTYYMIWDMYRGVLRMDLFSFRGKFILIGVYAIIAYMVFRACDSLSFDKLALFDISVSQSIGVFIVNTVTWLQICLIANGMITPAPMLVLTLVDIIVCVVFSSLFVVYFRKNGTIDDALLIYGSDSALLLKEKMDRKDGSYVIEEAVQSDSSLSAIEEAIDRHAAVIINDVPAVMRNDVLKYCFAGGKATYVVPKISDIMLGNAEAISTFDTPLMRIRNEGLSPVEAFIKRATDIVLSAAAMIPGSVIMLIIALAIRLEDGGPVLYTQRRVTKGGRTFDMLKFRSMIVDAEASTGAVLASEDDPRITRTGRLIRACRLDELPQLINIIKGDMSIVGPRPERTELTEELIKEMPEFAFRTKVKGGLTGYAQVYGKYNTTAYDKLRLDLMYIEKYSLLLDLKLIFMTPQILFRKEASEGVGKRQAADMETRREN